MNLVSSAIDWVEFRHNEGSREIGELTIRYKGKAWFYTYSGVPEKVYLGLVNSESLGDF